MLFVCKLAGAPGPAPEVGASLILLETPHGPVAQAFESEALARVVWQLYGAADGVFVLPEMKLSFGLKQKLESVPVVVYRTIADYDGATLNHPRFPWLDRLVHLGADGRVATKLSSERCGSLAAAVSSCIPRWSASEWSSRPNSSRRSC